MLAEPVAGAPGAHVVAVVLNYNGLEQTLACLESLAASDWPGLTVLVVDNDSEDDPSVAVTSRFGAEVIRNDVNLGFAGGMNVGLRRARELGADYVLLLNNDTVVDPAMARILVTTAAARPDAGIVSPLVLYRDMPGLVASAGLRFDPHRAYQGRPLAMGQRDDGRLSGVRVVDASPGTAMLVPTAALDAVGALDERLFLYLEDVDWSLRMRAHGLRVYMALDARLFHGVAQASGGEYSPLIAYYMARNTFVVCARHGPLRRHRRLARHIRILFVNLVHARRGARPAANAAAVLAGWRDYLLGRLGPRRSAAR